MSRGDVLAGLAFIAFMLAMEWPNRTERRPMTRLLLGVSLVAVGASLAFVAVAWPR